MIQKSINQNGIQALDISKNNFTTKQVKQIANLYEIDLNTPIKNKKRSPKYNFKRSVASILKNTNTPKLVVNISRLPWHNWINL